MSKKYTEEEILKAFETLFGEEYIIVKKKNAATEKTPLVLKSKNGDITEMTANKLKAIRQSQNRSLEQVCRVFGRTRGWLSLIESNKRDISIDDLDKLLNVYNIELSDFFKELKR